jgi:hypothetical protein
MNAFKFHFTLMSSLLSLLVVLPVLVHAGEQNKEEENVKLAKELGWLDDYKRGKEIVRAISSLRPDELQKTDIAFHRGEKVAFVGSGTSGATNDLMTKSGYYLRIVNPTGKDLRPQATGWSVIVRGKILQVWPANKVIEIEIRDKDWQLIESL